MKRKKEIKYINKKEVISMLFDIPCFAPAFAANMDKIPLPQPTSRTTFPLKNDLL